MSLIKEDKIYLSKLLSERKSHLDGLIRALETMGEHAFINEGLLNEGALKIKAYSAELDQINRILMDLSEE